MCSEPPAESGTFVVPRYLDQPQHEWPAWSREFLERVRGLGYPANIEKMRLVLAQGEASTTLADSVYAAIPRGPIVGSSGSAEAVA